MPSRKVLITEHSTSYQAITTKSPHGLQCLKKLFLEYDNDTPNRAILENLLARDFTDNENESERNIGREEAIQNIVNSRQRYRRHQIDLKRAICIEHDAKRQEVLFEGARFMSLAFDPDKSLDFPSTIDNKNDWLRVPFSGRLEIRVKENRYTLKDAEIEIVARRWTLDSTQLVRRDLLSRRRTTTETTMGPISPITDEGEAESQRRNELVGSGSGASGSLLRAQQSPAGTSQIGLPGGMSELPAALSALATTDSRDDKSLPPYPYSVKGSSTVDSGSSVDGYDRAGRV